MQAEQRAVAAAACALRLPVDSPPELVEACGRDEEGNLLAAEICRAAADAAIAERTSSHDQ